MQIPLGMLISPLVGYATNTNGANPNCTWGTCFLSLNAKTPGNFRLGDIKLSGSTWGDDWLQVINPATSIVDSSKNVTYYSVEEAGDPDLAEWEDENENCQDDVEYPFGTAFLCSFLSSDVTFTYAGQVNQDELISEISSGGNPNPYICNIYPGDLTFGQIKLEGSTWGDDWIQFIRPENSVVDSSKDITYYSLAEAGDPDLVEWEDENENCKDDVPLKRGEGFLCSFLSPNVKIIFPTYKAAE